MPEHLIPVAAPPGDPPRAISYRALFALLPGNLQIMVVAHPLATVAGLIWFKLSPDEYSGKVLFFAIITLPIYVVMIELFRRKLQRYRQVVGTVTAIPAGDAMEGFGRCKVLHYQYPFDGGTYDDEHMTADPKGLKVGDPVWVLVDPNKPSRSVLWVGA